MIAAARLPLAAQYPGPAESHAVELMIATQFAWAAMIFPALCGSWRTTMAAAGSAWVMLLLSTALAARPLADATPYAIGLILWMFALAAWRLALQGNRRSLAAASALAATWTIGGPLVWYFGVEFGSGRMPQGASIVYGPLQPLLIGYAPPPLGNAGLDVLLCAAGLCLWGITRRFRRNVPPDEK